MRTSFAAPLAISLLVVACGGKTPASQIVATVNGDEISVHQINNVLARIPALPPEQAGLAKKEILDKLVDQQLLVHHAVEQKLDRTPEVVAALEAGKREILAKAYLEHMVSAIPLPTTEEAQKYYADHPALFKQRRIYSLQEINLAAGDVPLTQLRELAATKSLPDVAGWLREKGIPFRTGSVSRPAEQLPLDSLPKLNELKEGQNMVLEAGKAVAIVRVAGTQLAPVSEAEALPQIKVFLKNQKAATAAQGELAQLRQKAKIDYAGEFAAPAVKTSSADAKTVSTANAATRPDPSALR